MVSTDQVATVTVPDSDPTVTYYANFASGSGSNFTITEDASISEHGTVTYKVNGTETAPVEGVINVKENDEITLIVTPNTGWIVDVDNVKAESYTTWDAAGARRMSAPDNIQILGDVTLTKSTTAENTWTFTMPAASVLVSAAYIPVAAFAPAEPSGTLAPTAAEGVIAGEDKAIIVAGTVANIPETTNPQGTVKYFVTDNKDMTAEQAAKANGWVETLPTAAGYTGSYADDFQVYVWYYIQAATGYADSEPQRIEVTVQSNLFDLAFNAANANTIEAEKATVTVGGTAATVTDGKLQGVKMGSEVKLEAKPGYKFRKVEVKKAASTPSLNITNPVVGQVIGSDGKNYAAANVPSGVDKVAMIAYVSGSNGLAIALADEGQMNWATAIETCAAHTPAFTGGTWKLPSQEEWKQMFGANGGSEGKYTGLNTAITTAGGTAFQNGTVRYWSSSEYNSDQACQMQFYSGDANWSNAWKTNGSYVRACLAF